MTRSFGYLRGGHIWNIVAAALNQGSTLIANILLANILIAEDFGRYGAIQISITSIASAAQLSAWSSAAYFCGRYRDTSPERMGAALFVIRAAVAVMAGGAALMLILLRNEYAATFLHGSRAGIEVGIAAAYIFFAGLNNYQIGVLVGLDSLKGYAQSSVIQGLAAVGLVAGLGYLGGVQWALSGLSIAAAVRWALTARLVSTALVRANVPLRRDGFSNMVSEVVRFSLPASANGLTYMASLWITAMLIVRQPGGLFLSALYVVCMNLKTLVLFAPQQANAASVAYLSRYRANAPNEYRKALIWNMSAVSLATCFAAVVVVSLAGYVLGLYGDEFRAGVVFLQAMMIAAVAEAIAYGLTQHFSSRGAMWTVFFAASLPRDVIVVLGVGFLLPQHGLEAVAWTFLASWVVYSVGLSIVTASSRRSVGHGD